MTSEAVNSLTWQAEVFYRRLMSVADDHGRYYGLSKLIRSACYPLLIDKVSDADIGKWLTECVTAALVSVYEASDSKRYVQIQRFGQRIQSKSKFPEPSTAAEKREGEETNGDPPLTTVNNRLVVDEVVDEGESKRTRTRKPIKTTLPADFGVSDRVKAWAQQKGQTRLAEHLESFRAKCSAKGYEYVDWDSAFMEAIRANWAGIQTPAQANGSASPASQRRLA